MGDVSACCLNLHIYPSKGRPEGTQEVQFRLTSTDNKLYLGRMGYNGVLLKQGETISLKEPCYNFPVGTRIIYPRISIEEIDTSTSIIQALHNNNVDNNNKNAVKRGTLELIDLACINSVRFDSTGCETYSYCSKRRIVDFSFIWLDDKPLIVEFDAKTQKVFLR